MMDFETWLWAKQKIKYQNFLIMPEKKAYYEAYDRYRSRFARFEAEVQLRDCRQTARELVALG